ncbi:MAG: carbohydrate ABC transporter permease [Anaerolineae bacterium]|jgi:putative aldouronate transport system permease protein
MLYDRSLRSQLFDVVNIVLMLVVVSVTLYPLYYVAIVSISDGNAVLRGNVSFYPIGINFQSYKLVFRTPTVIRALGNSVFYTTVGTAINLFMTALCAYPLARPRFSGKAFFTLMVTITMFFSGGIIPLYLLVMQLGLRNSLWALVLPAAITPWNMFIMRTYFQGLPEEMFEAATIDGASDLEILLRIVLPLSKPIFATLLLFYAVANWNQWFNALLFLDDNYKFPIQLVLRGVVIQGRMEQGPNLMSPAMEHLVVEQSLKYATVMVATLPILLVYPFVQQYFVKGVMIGAIKG